MLSTAQLAFPSHRLFPCPTGGTKSQLTNESPVEMPTNLNIDLSVYTFSQIPDPEMNCLLDVPEFVSL